MQEGSWSETSGGTCVPEAGARGLQDNGAPSSSWGGDTVCTWCAPPPGLWRDRGADLCEQLQVGLSAARPSSARSWRPHGVLGLMWVQGPRAELVGSGQVGRKRKEVPSLSTLQMAARAPGHVPGPAVPGEGRARSGGARTAPHRVTCPCSPRPFW